MEQKIELSTEEFNKIEDVIENFLNKGFQNETPKMVVLTGPIASGKTTIRREKYSKDYVLIDSGELFDAFKEGSGEDSKRRADSMMVAGVELVKRSIMGKKNIVIEITVDNAVMRDKLENILEKMPSLGYKVETQYIHCDAEECQRRNSKGRDNVSSHYSTNETLHYFLIYFANL